MPDYATPEQLAQAQLDAYNAHDIEAFAACYNDEVAVYQYPEQLLYRGIAELRERYAKRFSDPLLFAHLAHRIVMDDTVLDQEVVRLTLPEGAGVVHATAIYRMAEGKIYEVRFIYGAKEVGGQLPPTSTTR